MEAYKTNHANIGDIINSEEFAFGYYESKYDSNGYMHIDKDKSITVDGRTETYPFQYYNSKNSDSDSKLLTTDLSAYNKSRGQANFIVEDARLSDGSGNDWPDGWRIIARRLSKDNFYNPKGELIQFYQSGCFSCMIKEVNVVGKMQQQFVLLEKYDSKK